MKMLSSVNYSDVGRAVCLLTYILAVCAVALKFLGVFPKLNMDYAFLLGLFTFLSFFIKRDSSDSANLFIATLIVGDASYILSLAFLLGRAFIAHF